MNETHNGHHTTGITGSKYLYGALAEYVHGDTAMRLLHNTDYPSFGHLFSLGATTFWECWGEPEIDAKWGARSLNHPMQGAFDKWFYDGLAGIRPDPARTGFRRVIFSPQIIEGLSSAKADFGSLYGNNHAEWKVEDGVLTYQISLPANTEGRVRLPVGDPSLLQEGGKPVLESPGVQLLSQDERISEFAVPCGQYVFTTKWPPAPRVITKSTP